MAGASTTNVPPSGYPTKEENDNNSKVEERLKEEEADGGKERWISLSGRHPYVRPPDSMFLHGNPHRPGFARLDSFVCNPPAHPDPHHRPNDCLAQSYVMSMPTHTPFHPNIPHPSANYHNHLAHRY
eukprot:TRINITY_DN5772_c0_g1_i1.p1 TRINITY_DN5772_c0_g1~~TRINITY_DN5772_c0_g1_i1.p1  ORF type:complete len:137 (+),score=23.35 TRINITY_DN5772_c0_g1_i1:33-413(+)